MASFPPALFAIPPNPGSSAQPPPMAQSSAETPVSAATLDRAVKDICESWKTTPEPVVASSTGLPTIPEEKQELHEQSRKGVGTANRACQWQADLGVACMDLAEMLGDEKAKHDIPQFKGQLAFNVLLTKMLDKQNTHTNFLEWLDMAQDPPPGYNFGSANGVDAGVPWRISPVGVVSPQPSEVLVFVVADSTLFFARGGKKSKNQSIMEEVDFFLGKTTKGLKFMPIHCQEGQRPKIWWRWCRR